MDDARLLAGTPAARTVPPASTRSARSRLRTFGMTDTLFAPGLGFGLAVATSGLPSPLTSAAVIPSAIQFDGPVGARLTNCWTSTPPAPFPSRTDTTPVAPVAAA